MMRGCCLVECGGMLAIRLGPMFRGRCGAITASGLAIRPSPVRKGGGVLGVGGITGMGSAVRGFSPGAVAVGEVIV